MSSSAEDSHHVAINMTNLDVPDGNRRRTQSRRHDSTDTGGNNRSRSTTPSRNNNNRVNDVRISLY